MLDAKARRVEGKKKKEEPLRFFASLAPLRRNE
jgi:hypothetical protein